MQCLLFLRRQKRDMTAEIILTEEQEYKLSCIAEAQDEPQTTQELIQALFDEALTANFIYLTGKGIT